MIIDASVAIKLLIPEADSVVAEAVLARFDLAAPDFLLLEVANGLSRAKRRGRISEHEVGKAWEVCGALPIKMTPWSSLADSALDLSLGLSAAFYDCLYLALALEQDDVVVTADARFVRAVQSRPALNGRAVLLSDL